MIATFLDAPLIAQIAFVVGGLSLLLIAGLLVWAWWWPVEDEPSDYFADELPPNLKEFPHE